MEEALPRILFGREIVEETAFRHIGGGNLVKQTGTQKVEGIRERKRRQTRQFCCATLRKDNGTASQAFTNMASPAPSEFGKLCGNPLLIQTY